MSNLIDPTYSNFLQSKQWEQTNQLIGHQTFRLPTSKTLIIFKKAKRASYLELAGGPLIDWQDPVIVDQTFAEIRTLAKSLKASFVRLRPQLPDTPKYRQLMHQLGLRLAPMHLHAEHTVILDLAPSLDQLLAGMRRQTRYEIRRSLKLQIPVYSGDQKSLFELFYKLQQDTARRQNFVPPTKSTLLAEHQAFKSQAKIYYALDPSSNSKSPNLDNLLAMGLVLVDQSEAVYFEAASTELNRKLPGAYALQWQIIQDLKADGIKYYNLWGIAPENQPHHRYAKVTTFKTGFGGEAISYLPAHDLIIRPIAYLPNLVIETIRKKRRHLS